MVVDVLFSHVVIELNCVVLLMLVLVVSVSWW